MIEMTIRVPDEIFERIRHDAKAHQSNPEQVAADLLTQIFAPEKEKIPRDVPSTVARLRVWAEEQSNATVRPPLSLGRIEREELDRDLEDLFASIQLRTEAIPQKQIERDVREALKGN